MLIVGGGFVADSCAGMGRVVVDDILVRQGIAVGSDVWKGAEENRFLTVMEKRPAGA